MGLDIYLYRYNDYNETIQKEQSYQEASEKMWEDAGKYEDLTQEQKDSIREKTKELAKSMGLNDWGDDKENKEKIEINSSLYPDHYFKIGYFRSSYNEGGINHILENLGLPRLNEILVGDTVEYHIQPDWNKALQNVQKVIEQFKNMPAYRVSRVAPNIFDPNRGPVSEKEALDIFLSEIEKQKDSTFGGSYSNINGEFHLTEPLKVLALIPGKDKMLGNRFDCAYVVYESSNEWYIQALEIIEETCKYVLSQENINQYYLHWSG